MELWGGALSGGAMGGGVAPGADWKTGELVAGVFNVLTRVVL